MLAIEDKANDILKQLAIHLEALVATYLLGVLLHGPYGPQGYIGLLDLVDLARYGFARHKLAECTLAGLHHLLEVVDLANGQCQSGQGDKRIAGATLEPRITRHEITVLVLLLAMELVGGGNQTVIEVIAWHAVGHLFVEQLLKARSLGLRGRSSEDDALALLDRHLEIAGHVEVLVRGITTLLLLGILYAAIPVGHEDELVFLRELHVEIGIARIHTGLDSIVDLKVLATSSRVLVSELANASEGQERTETQRGS